MALIPILKQSPDVSRHDFAFPQSQSVCVGQFLPIL
jgi:hypothetical protein